MTSSLAPYRTMFPITAYNIIDFILLTTLCSSLLGTAFGILDLLQVTSGTIVAPYRRVQH